MKGMKKLCYEMKMSWYNAKDEHVAYNVLKKEQTVINEMSTSL
jgi:hypothetical protein